MDDTKSLLSEILENFSEIIQLLSITELNKESIQEISQENAKELISKLQENVLPSLSNKVKETVSSLSKKCKEFHGKKNSALLIRDDSPDLFEGNENSLEQELQPVTEDSNLNGPDKSNNSNVTEYNENSLEQELQPVTEDSNLNGPDKSNKSNVTECNSNGVENMSDNEEDAAKSKSNECQEIMETSYDANAENLQNEKSNSSESVSDNLNNFEIADSEPLNNETSCNEESENIIKDATNGLSNKKEETQNGEQEEPIKSYLKLVDINKLVDPNSKNLLKATFDESVIILTSSEDSDCESDHKRKQFKLRIRKVADTNDKNKRSSKRSDSDDRKNEISKSDKRSLRNHRKDTNNKKLRLRQEKTSFNESSDDNLKKKTSGRLRKRRGRVQFKEIIQISSVSESSSSSDSSVSNKKTTHKESKKNDKSIKEINLSAVDVEKDVKFNSDAYVDLVRIPCEEMQERYSRNKEILDIKRLGKLDALKNMTSKRSRKNSTDSSESETLKSNTKKSKLSLKSKETTNSPSNSDEDQPELLDVVVELEKAIPVPSDEIPNEVEAVAEAILNKLNSDDDGNEAKSSDDDDKEEAEKNKDKEKDDKGKNNKKNKEVESEEEQGEKKNKSKSDDTPNNSDKENSEKSDKEESKEDSDNEEDGKSKKKSSWKKDKLLTSKLSSTDSEEEFAKFRNKKDKDQVKRKMKQKKKIVISDSDSDNYGKKKQGTSSSSSSSDSESDKEESSEKEDDEKTEEVKKKNKRIKKVEDSSEEDADKSTRKKIRTVWGKDSLAESTRKAEAAEKERKARISEKQKKYNQIYDGKELNAKVDKLVLDFDEKTEEELMRVDDKIVENLKPHQASGIQFMWDACFESVKRAKTSTGSGCILAHCMGLGKTLQVVALTHTLLQNTEITGVKKVMVVCPVSTVLNWVAEYKKWIPNEDDVDLYELVSCKQNNERGYYLKDWHNNGGVLIIGYQMFRTLSNNENKRVSKKLRATFYSTLVDPGPDMVICDEGHLLKNEKSGLSIAMNRIKTLRRIVLTGTPLQNNLKEYFCMVQFIKPNLLGTYKEYLNRFVNPITNGQYTDSTQHDIQIMRRRSHVLHKMLDGVVQRRDYAVLAPYLPPKYEYVLFLSLTDVQIKLYRHYMENLARRETKGRMSFLFIDFQELQRICTHPRVLLDKSIADSVAKSKNWSDEEEGESSEGSIKNFIDDGDESSAKSTSSESDGDESDSNKKSKHKKPKQRMTRAARAAALENGDVLSEPEIEKGSDGDEWWRQFCTGSDLEVIAHGTKLFLMMEILKECEQIGDKVLVFSQSLFSLNVIEYFLNKIDEATQNKRPEDVGGYTGSWACGLDYFRLDGSSSCDNRAYWCDSFNNPENTRARLFLISTRAGGLGINLVAANRVIIFDVSWNPSHDVQSIYRVYRFGQLKPCYIYRFVIYGTMEMKIYERQVTKQAISKRVIDEQQIDRHYNQNDLAELYKFEPTLEDRPVPLVPKDVLLGELLQKYDNRILKYHEHQSLLENRTEEVLNEDERKAAWEEFENEKVQRQHFNQNQGPINNNLVGQALRNLVMRDNPSWTAPQVNSVLPTLARELEMQVKQGDLTMQQRVINEVKLIQQMQQQKMKEYLYQQQMMQLLRKQQQQNQLLNKMGNINPSDLQKMLFQNQPSLLTRPGSSRATPVPNPNEIIDLND